MKCPSCAEVIKDEAAKCRFCGQVMTKAVKLGWPEFYRNSAGLGYLDPEMLFIDYQEHMGLSISEGCLSAGDPIGCLLSEGSDADYAIERRNATRLRDAIMRRAEQLSDDSAEKIFLLSLSVYLRRFLSLVHEEKGLLWANDPRNLRAMADGMFVLANRFHALDKSARVALEKFLDSSARALRKRADEIDPQQGEPVSLIDPEFASNPDPRVACVLLLDTSSSMGGAPIDSLNEGLKVFQQDLQGDPLASRRVEIAIVTFGGSCQLAQDFSSASQFVPPVLRASGLTPMGEAIHKALDMVQERKQNYKDNGIMYYQPWVFLITDGEPTDKDPSFQWQGAAQRVQAEMSGQALTFFAVGVKGANMEVLSQITPRVIQLEGLKFRELFLWLSQSQRRVSSSIAGTQTELPRVDFGSPV